MAKTTAHKKVKTKTPKRTVAAAQRERPVAIAAASRRLDRVRMPSPSAKAARADAGFGEDPNEGKYVYCIIKTETPLGFGPLGIGAEPAETHTVNFRDIAAVAAHVLAEEGRHDGKAYEVTGPQALGYADVAATFSRVLDRPVAYVDVPAVAAKQSMTQAGMPEWQADAINELSEEMKQGHFATVTDVVERVGKKTPVTLEQFVRENAGAFT